MASPDFVSDECELPTEYKGQDVNPDMMALVINIRGGIALDAVEEFLRSTLSHEREEIEAVWAWTRISSATNVDKLLGDSVGEDGKKKDNEFVQMKLKDIKGMRLPALALYRNRLKRFAEGNEYEKDEMDFPHTSMNHASVSEEIGIVAEIIEEKIQKAHPGAK